MLPSSSPVLDDVLCGKNGIGNHGLDCFGAGVDVSAFGFCIQEPSNQAVRTLAIAANNVIDFLGDAARSRLEEIKSLPKKPGRPAPRVDGYVGNLLSKILTDLE